MIAHSFAVGETLKVPSTHTPPPAFARGTHDRPSLQSAVVLHSSPRAEWRTESLFEQPAAAEMPAAAKRKTETKKRWLLITAVLLAKDGRVWKSRAYLGAYGAVHRFLPRIAERPTNPLALPFV